MGHDKYFKRGEYQIHGNTKGPYKGMVVGSAGHDIEVWFSRGFPGRYNKAEHVRKKEQPVGGRDGAGTNVVSVEAQSYSNKTERLGATRDLIEP